MGVYLILGQRYKIIDNNVVMRREILEGLGGSWSGSEWLGETRKISEGDCYRKSCLRV